MNPTFDADCRRCPRLASFLDSVRRAEPDYYCGPVPSFGDPSASLVLVGLAPGLHGANRTGRPFTGDYAGRLLYATLHAAGFASRPDATAADDGLVLKGCRIPNPGRSPPPATPPRPAEVRRCSRYLAADLRALPNNGVV